jgi:HCO3- transporter family
MGYLPVMFQILSKGVTGPVMVFDEALFKFTKGAEVDFLACRVWIAVWCAIIALVAML